MADSEKLSPKKVLEHLQKQEAESAHADARHAKVSELKAEIRRLQAQRMALGPAGHTKPKGS